MPTTSSYRKATCSRHDMAETLLTLRKVIITCSLSGKSEYVQSYSNEVRSIIRQPDSPTVQKSDRLNSRVAGHRFLLICLNGWHTAKLYIFGKSRMWLIEISMSSLSSVVTLWDNLGQRSNPYFSKKYYQTLAISFLRTFFVIFIQKTGEMIKVYNPI